MSTKPLTLKVLENCKITPPINTTPTTFSLPLTFLDIPWLLYSPSQPLFFYEFPHSTSHFTTTIVPKLKHSLSLTLQHYYPFAETFVPANNELKFTLNNSISFTVAESNGDFEYLCSNNLRDVNEFHPLVPKLQQIFSFEIKEFPLLAIQITLFPNSGFSIGLAFHNVVDGRTFSYFIKTWSSYCSSSTFDASQSLKLLPFYDRSVIIDTKDLRKVLLEECRKRNIIDSRKSKSKVDFSNMTRATFSMSLSRLEKIKKFIVESCKQKKMPQLLDLSPYNLSCAYFWVCLLKTQQEFVNEKVVNEDVTHFEFVAGVITRLVEYQIPNNYFGNCLGFGKASLRKKELLGEDGIVFAAREIEGTVEKLGAR